MFRHDPVFAISIAWTFIGLVALMYLLIAS
jgi:hypothetical protein